jgi:adenine-specific DNA-methyltransferase
MAQTAQQLELTWTGKAPKQTPEPRTLTEDSALGYLPATGASDAGLCDNRLIHGDNLPALHALAPEFAGRIACVYMDPPFNTGQAFEHYADGVEHAGWLTLMRDRLEALHVLMAEHGTLFVHIDDNELGYLIVVLDEIFGRANRLSVVTFKQGAPTGHKAINPGCVSTTNFILMYAKNRNAWRPNRVFVPRERDKRYAQFVMHRDAAPAQWEMVPLLQAFAQMSGMAVKEARARIKASPRLLDNFVFKHADRVAQLVRPNYTAVSKAARQMIDASKAQPEVVFHLPRRDHSDFYFMRGQRILFYENKIKLIDGTEVSGEPLTTLWDDLLSNNLHKEGGVNFAKSKKPEALLKRMIALSTQVGEWVLDAFAGSGTTGAVAHKMQRQWIMMEAGEHCQELIVPRLHRVIEGRDNSGVTADVKWQDGGGFRFFHVRACQGAKAARAQVVATAP